MLKSIKSNLIFSTGNSFHYLNISTINLNKCIILLRDANNHVLWTKKQKDVHLNNTEDLYLSKELKNLLEK